MEENQENKESEQKEEPKQYEEMIVEVQNPDFPGGIRKQKMRKIHIEWEGKPAEILIKKWGFGERCEYEDAIAKIQNRGRQTTTQISLKEAQEQALLRGIHTAPFNITKHYITYELDSEIGDLLYGEISNFNMLGESKK